MPSATTTSVWKRPQGSRSSRAGMIGLDDRGRGSALSACVDARAVNGGHWRSNRIRAGANPTQGNELSCNGVPCAAATPLPSDGSAESYTCARNNPG